MRARDRGPATEVHHPTRVRWLLRVMAIFTVFAGFLGNGVYSSPPADALPRGEVITVPGGLILANFVLPGGKRAYCIEVVMGEPTGQATYLGRRSALPGVPGAMHSWGDAHGMRQMNYLLDRYGQTGNATTAIAVQLTIWRMRENFQSNNPVLNQKIATLQSSQQGRNLLARSDQLYAEAKVKATAPKAAPAVSGKLTIVQDPAGVAGRFRVSYPKGTVSLSVSGGTFAKNGAATLAVSASEASAVTVNAKSGSREVKVAGSWRTTGTAGWESKLDIYDTTTASGGVGQRVAVAAGKTSVPERRGDFAAVTAAVPPPPAPPVASSQAQPSAEVGGTMVDELRVRAQKDTTVQMWPEAVASFTAYLLPVAGSQKYSAGWEPVLGEPYEAQQEDEETGQPLWQHWWADEHGELLLDEAGNPISMTDAAGEPTSGTAANDTEYPIVRLDEEGEPLLDENEMPQYYSARTPVMEQRRDPVLWSEQELASMSEKQRCLAQPVFQESGIAVPKIGTYSSTATPVRSSGTIHWVERVHSKGKLVHEGICGLANETTRVNQPGVVTQAPAELQLGDSAYDTALVSGVLQAGVEYSVMFEAYSAPEEVEGGLGSASSEPMCVAENLIFRSARIPVTETGTYQSPGFVLTPAHGTKIWWVETLEYDDGSGMRTLHRGTCGLENETTLVSRPTIETQAMPEAVVGDLITDTAMLGGGFATNEGASWEVEFRGYRAETSEAGDAVCDVDNVLFEIPAVAVQGPGSVTSAAVRALPEWRGDIWWVESLWLTQGETRTEFARGVCGLTNETTIVEGASVETAAVPLAVVGDAIVDTATVTGPLSTREGVRHELTFAIYRGDATLTDTDDAVCTAENLLSVSDPVAVTGPGKYDSPGFTVLPDHGSTVWWVESLWLIDESGTEGPDRSLVAQGRCGVAHETTSIQRPTVSTVATAQVLVGEMLYDTAIVEGAFSVREDIEYRVRFTAYERPSKGEMTCSANTEIESLSDPEGVQVTKAGQYESKRVKTGPEHVGLGGFVETLVLIVGGEEHVIHRGVCGAESENFEIVPVDVVSPPNTPVLSATGAPGLSPLWVSALVLALSGAGVLGFTRGRKRR